MRLPTRLVLICVAIAGSALGVLAQGPAEKPKPDAQFGNWLFKTPGAPWQRSEREGALVFSIPRPGADFVTLTLFPDAPAESFADQFEHAVGIDQQAKGTVRLEADSGAKAGKAAEGYDTLTRSLRAETADFHTQHLYFAGQSAGHFGLAAFQTSSEGSWKQYGAEAARFILSLKLASALTPDQVATLLGKPTAVDAPTLPGLDFDAAPAAVAPKPQPPVAAKPATPPAAAEKKIPDRPLNQSPLVVNDAVIQKDGKPINGLKLSQHDSEIHSPSITVDSKGVIHVAFVEKHRTTYKYAVYYRSSADGGKTWSETRNMSEDLININVGLTRVLVDGRDRVYLVFRTGLAENFGAALTIGGSSPSNVVYRVMENGRWSKVLPVSEPGTKEVQTDAAYSFFAGVDAAGRVQVIWNVLPDKWHPEMTKISGTYHQHNNGVGTGLVFQSTLDGATASKPWESFSSPISGVGSQDGYGARCDSLDALNGYFDAAGKPHVVAEIKSTVDESFKNKSRYQLFENGQPGALVDLPALSYHGWNDIPTLLRDAQGRHHLIALFYAGENPSVRDYLLGSDEEPVIIRKAASVKGTVDSCQAYQGPGGRMIAVMQMNDTGERASGETYISVSTGNGWSTPVNVTNNAGRYKFVSKQTSSESNIAVATSYYPGPAAVTYDHDGRLLALMINNEYGLFNSSAFGVSLAGGSSSTPTLQFLKL